MAERGILCHPLPAVPLGEEDRPAGDAVELGVDRHQLGAVLRAIVDHVDLHGAAVVLRQERLETGAQACGILVVRRDHDVDVR